MNHIILLFLCALSVEIFIRFRYIYLISSIVKVSKKAIYIILNKNISEHWKENIIPKFSLRIMQYSLQIIFMCSTIILFFLFAETFFSGFFTYLFSLNGIFKSILFAFSYAFLRKIIVN